MSNVEEICPNRIKVVQRYTECSVDNAKLTLSHLDRMDSEEFSGGIVVDDGQKQPRKTKSYVRFDDWEEVLSEEFRESGFTNQKIELLTRGVVRALQERFAGKCLYLPKVEKVHVPKIR